MPNPWHWSDALQISMSTGMLWSPGELSVVRAAERSPRSRASRPCIATCRCRRWTCWREQLHPAGRLGPAGDRLAVVDDHADVRGRAVVRGHRPLDLAARAATADELPRPGEVGRARRRPAATGLNEKPRPSATSPNCARRRDEQADRRPGRLPVDAGAAEALGEVHGEGQRVRAVHGLVHGLVEQSRGRHVQVAVGWSSSSNPGT